MILNKIINHLNCILLKKKIQFQIKSNSNIRFWWRDDDIVEMTEGLTNILNISSIHNIPIFLAVIPEKISYDAICLIKEYSNIAVLQHGYSHNNYAKDGEPLNEFGMDRDITIQLNEIRLGFNKLSNLFNDQFLPIFVPPWGHVSHPIIKELGKIGFKGISCIGKSNTKYPDLINNNVHIDIHSWQTKSETEYKVYCKKYSEVLKEISYLLAHTIHHQDSDISVGILTHSQIMSEEDFNMIMNLIFDFKKIGIKFFKRDKLLSD